MTGGDQPGQYYRRAEQHGLVVTGSNPAIDKGSNSLEPDDDLDLDGDGDYDEPLPYDIDGFRRISGQAVDIGACEHLPNVFLPIKMR